MSSRASRAVALVVLASGAALLAVAHLEAASPWAVDTRAPLELSVSQGGFSPRDLRVHVGEPVQLLARATDVEHCLAIDAFRVEKRLVPGRSVEVRFTPDQTGRFPVRCCLGGDHSGESGTLIVED